MLSCPECGADLHRLAEDGEYKNLYKCFTGPTYWRDVDGKLVKAESPNDTKGGPDE